MNTMKFKPYAFLLHWVINAVGVWLVASVASLIAWVPIAVLISVLDQYPVLAPIVRVISTVAIFTIPGMSIGYILGEVQQNILRDFLKWDFAPHWVRYSSIGGLIGGIAVIGFSVLFGAALPERIQWMMLLPLFILPISIMQWRILDPIAHEAWMWILGNLVAAIVFSGLFFSTQPMPFIEALPVASLILWLMAAIALGAITGVVILWLYQHQISEWDDENAELAPVYVEVRNQDDQ
ncbi:MAG: hypothetical protein WBC91_08530 [Phototrophicaceae bacterium]